MYCTTLTSQPPHLRAPTSQIINSLVQTNPGEQFFMFSSLCAWLVRKAGQQFDQPQEQEDPNTVIANILQHVRNSGVVIDFAPSKLKAGYGEHAIFILDRLADETLRSNNWQWRKPVPPPDVGNEEPEQVDDDDEIILERLEEEMAEDYSDEDEADILHINQVTPPVTERGSLATSGRPGNIMEGSVNVDSWRLEVERVAPSLKVTLRSESRDWRAHLDQIHHHRNKMEACLDSAVTDLGNNDRKIFLTSHSYIFREVTEGAGGHPRAGGQQGEARQPAAGAAAQQLQSSLPEFGPGQGAAEAGQQRHGGQDEDIAGTE